MKKILPSFDDAWRKKWVKRTLDNDAKGWPFEVVEKELELEVKKLKLKVYAEYDHQIKDNEFDTDEVNDQLKEIQSNQEKLIEAQRDALPEKLFARIDRLQAKLKNLIAKSKEIEKYRK